MGVAASKRTENRDKEGNRIMTSTRLSSVGGILSKWGRQAIWLICLPILLLFGSSARAERETLSLDGTWEIEDGKSPTKCPRLSPTPFRCPAWRTWRRRPWRTWTSSSAASNWRIASAPKLSPPEWLTRVLEGQGGPGPQLLLVSQDLSRAGARERWRCSRSTRPSSARRSG